MGELLGIFPSLAIYNARILVAMSVLPFFAKAAFPATVRTALAMSCSILFLPAILTGGGAPANATFADTTTIVFKEAFIGFLLGFGLGLVFWAAEMAGALIDFQTGATSSQAYDPVMGNQDSVTAMALSRIVITLFFASGGLKIWFGAVFQSYVIWPPGKFSPTLDNSLTSLAIDQTANALSLALLIAGPVAITLLLFELAIGLVNRGAPRLEINSIATSIKGTLAIGILFISLPYIANKCLEIFASYEKLAHILKEVVK
jgi:type III secretion protein T